MHCEKLFFVLSDEGARLHTNPCFWSSKIVWATNLEINKNIDVIIIPNYLNLLELIVEFLNDPQKSIQIFPDSFQPPKTPFFFQTKTEWQSCDTKIKILEGNFRRFVQLLYAIGILADSTIPWSQLSHQLPDEILQMPNAIIVTTFHLKQKPLE